MLCIEEVEVKVIGKTLKHYKSKGHDVKCLENIKVLNIDLSNGSGIKVRVKCDFCGKIFYPKWYTYLKQTENSIIKKDCCVKCKMTKTQETNELLYGSKYFLQTKEGYEKFQNTILNTYGVENISQIPDYKEKREQTCVEKYGKPYYAQTDEWKDRYEQTCMDKYGVKNISQLNENKEKVKKSNLKKYGFEHCSQMPEFKEKVANTNLKKYGVKTFLLTEECNELMINRNLELYGYEYAMQNKEEAARRITLSRKTMSDNKNVPSSKEQIYLNDLFKGELNYSIDNCCVDILLNKNIIIEYNGGGHDLAVKYKRITQDEFNKKEMKRDLFLKSKGYKMIKIISSKDKLPNDEILLNLLKYAIDILEGGRSWFHINIDNGTISYKECLLPYNFGDLRNISKRYLRQRLKGEIA